MNIRLSHFATLIIRYKFLIGVVIVFFILRIPSIFEPHWYVDEGIYATIGSVIRQGGKMYVDAYDHKPQLMFWIHSLFVGTHALFLAKVVNIGLGITSLLGLWKLAKLLFNERVAKVAIALAAVLWGTPIFEGNIANAENFFIPLSIWSLVLILSNNQTEKYARAFLFAGVLYGLSFLIKFHPVFDLVAIGIYLVITTNLRDWRILFKKFILLGIGFLLPLIAVSIYEYFTGGLGLFIKAAFIDAYLYTGEAVSAQGTIWGSAFVKFSVCFAAILSLGWLTKKQKLSSKQFLVWSLLLLELFGALLSGRVFAHYLLHGVLGFSLMVGMLFTQKSINLKHIVISLVPLILIAIYFTSGTKLPTIPADRKLTLYLFPIEYYYNFVQHLTKGTIGSTQYNAFFSYKSNYLNELVRSLDDYSYNYVYVYSDLGWVYPRIQQKPPTKIFLAFQIYYKDIEQNEVDIVQELQSKQVELIVIDKSLHVFDGLAALLESNYYIDSETERFSYYLRK